MIPYLDINGQWTLTDKEVMEYFYKMDIADVFYTGEVKTSVDFVTYCKNPNNHFIFFDTGVTWINNLKDKRALCHLNIWKNAEKIAKESIDYLFSLEVNGSAIIEVLVGFTPTWNKRAVKFAAKTFTTLGVIPKFEMTNRGLTDTLISYMSRDQWVQAEKKVQDSSAKWTKPSSEKKP